MKKLLERVRAYISGTPSYVLPLLDLVKAGDIVIDCGANIGVVSKPLLKKGAIVHSFEPNPFAFKALSENLDKSSRSFLYNEGVWDKDGILKLFLHKSAEEDQVKFSTGSSLISSKPNISTGNFVEVKVINLMTFIKQLDSPVKLLKLDIEGAECEVLEELIKSKLYQKIDHIFVETHEKKITDLAPRISKIKSMIKDNNINNINLDWV